MDHEHDHEPEVDEAATAELTARMRSSFERIGLALPAGDPPRGYRQVVSESIGSCYVHFYDATPEEVEAAVAAGEAIQPDQTKSQEAFEEILEDLIRDFTREVGGIPACGPLYGFKVIVARLCNGLAFVIEAWARDTPALRAAGEANAAARLRRWCSRPLRGRLAAAGYAIRPEAAGATVRVVTPRRSIRIEPVMSRPKVQSLTEGVAADVVAKLAAAAPGDALRSVEVKTLARHGRVELWAEAVLVVGTAA